MTVEKILIIVRVNMNALQLLDHIFSGVTTKRRYKGTEALLENLKNLVPNCVPFKLVLTLTRKEEGVKGLSMSFNYCYVNQ